MPVKIINIALWLLMALAALAVGGYALTFFVTHANPQFQARFAAYPLRAHLHVIPGGVALILGAVQFNSWVRGRLPALHRWTGRIYAISVLAAGTGGLLIAQYAHGGMPTRLGFSCLAVAWLFSIVQAWRFARERDFTNHQRWMIRNYALTLAAVTLRIYLPLLREPGELSFDDAYTIVAWFSWIPNLVIAEWFLVERITRRN